MPNHHQWRLYVAWLLVADAIMLGAAFLVAAAVRMRLALLPQPGFDRERYALVAAGLIPVLLVLLYLRRAYARPVLLGGPEEYARVVSGCTYGTLLVAAASFLYGSAPLVSRGWLLAFWGSAIVFVWAGRFILRRVAYRLRSRGWFVRQVIVVGANDHGRAIAQQLHAPQKQGLRVLGFLDDYAAAEQWTDPERSVESDVLFQVLGHPREASVLAKHLGADLLVVVPSALSWESQQLLTRLGQVSHDEFELEVRLAPTNYDFSVYGVEAAPLAYVPLLRLHSARLSSLDAVLQAAVDRVVAGLLLVALLPAMAWSASIARLRGVRPVMQSHLVLGRGGRPVTMRVLAPEIGGRGLARITPALLGVVRGQLALVGPRPLSVEARALYEGWDEVLLAVLPGLTGPWRFLPRQAPELDRVMADVWWVRNWTIWQYLFFLFQTARVVWPKLFRARPEAAWSSLRYVLSPTPAASQQLVNEEVNNSPTARNLATDGLAVEVPWA